MFRKVTTVEGLSGLSSSLKINFKLEIRAAYSNIDRGKPAGVQNPMLIILSHLYAHVRTCSPIVRHQQTGEEIKSEIYHRMQK